MMMFSDRSGQTLTLQDKACVKIATDHAIFSTLFGVFMKGTGC